VNLRLELEQLGLELATTKEAAQAAAMRCAEAEAQAMQLGTDETDILICLAEVQAEKLVYKRKLRYCNQNFGLNLEISDDEQGSDDEEWQ
jgi:hypothetical protein